MDPLVGSAIISGGSSLLGGLFGNNSAKKAAKRQMEFQERMARNAHQYEVEDLTKAGLNPVLSAGGSGSASPAGAMASVPNDNIIGDAVSSALQSKMINAQIDNMKMDTQKKQSERDATDTQGALNTIMFQNQKKTGLLLDAQLPEAAASAKMYSSEYGTLFKGIKDLSGGVADVIKSGKDIHQMRDNPGMKLPTKKR